MHGPLGPSLPLSHELNTKALTRNKQVFFFVLGKTNNKGNKVEELDSEAQEYYNDLWLRSLYQDKNNLLAKAT